MGQAKQTHQYKICWVRFASPNLTWEMA